VGLPTREVYPSVRLFGGSHAVEYEVGGQTNVAVGATVPSDFDQVGVEGHDGQDHTEATGSLLPDTLAITYASRWRGERLHGVHGLILLFA